jgi:hypothetical protein
MKDLPKLVRMFGRRPDPHSPVPTGLAKVFVREYSENFSAKFGTKI